MIRYILFAILLLGVFRLNTINAQSTPGSEDFVFYTEEVVAQDFEKAIELENRGNIKEAVSLYYGIAQFDSTSYRGHYAVAKLDSIWQIKKRLFKERLLGEWRWIWSGTNWGTSDSPRRCDCEEYWSFQDAEIIVTKANEIKEKLVYKIERDFSSIGTSSFVLKINDGEKQWRLRIYSEVENDYYLMERSEKTTFFLAFRDVTLSSGCVCGCPEKRFEKV